MFGAVLKGSATLSGRDADIPQVELESEGEGTRKKECSGNAACLQQRLRRV